MNIIHSDMLDFVLAFRGSKTSYLLSDSRDAHLRQFDSGHRYILYYPRGSKLMNAFFQKVYTDLVDHSLSQGEGVHGKEKL